MYNKTVETAVDIKDKVVEVSSNVYNTVSQKVVEGYTVTKDVIVGATETISQNASYAVEKIK